MLHGLSPPSIAAQAGTTTGVIRGTVSDPLGAPLPGAVIVIQHRETDLLTTVETSAAGTFARTLLPPGTYDLTVAAETGGFGSERIEGAGLRVGETLDVAVQLRVVAAETVTVVSDLPSPIDSADVTSAQRVLEDVVDGLPSNGRNFVNLTLLTPGASISQGPDGDELNIAGQRGIFNNFIVDGADFNNPFFGEQRGGQRPAFTFNQDAIEELVVVNQGATAEYGRSAGGFVNVITKSGTNAFTGSAHYFGQWDEIAAPFPEARGGGRPDFYRNQAGVTWGGPLVRDRAFFFLAYDLQEAAETKQTTRNVQNPENLLQLERFLHTRWPGLFDDEFGPIRRTDDARALLAKLDLNLDGRHQASFKYNYTSSGQANGTFDVDAWGASANGIESDRSNAFNGSLRSLLTNALSNELRIQWAREDRPRWYQGPLQPDARLPGPPQFAALGGRPFPDITMDFDDGFRIGLPFFLPIDPSFDTRLQVVDNVSYAVGNHLIKTGLEYNRTRAEQQFVGLANSRYIFDSVGGFIGFVTHGSQYVTCSDGSANAFGNCSPGAQTTGPVLLYLQSATVPGVPADQLGRQQFETHELGAFVQDTWHPHERVTLDLGLRWDGAWNPEVFVDPARHLLRVVPRRSPVPFRWPNPERPGQPAAAHRTRLGSRRRRAHRAARQCRFLRRAHSDARLRPAPLDQRCVPADPLPQQRRRFARSGPRHRPADRCLELSAVPAGHSGRRPRSAAAAHVVARRRPRKGSGTGPGRQHRLHSRAYRQPLSLRQPQRRRARRAVRDRDAPVRRRHQHVDRRREQRALLSGTAAAGRNLHKLNSANADL